MENEKTIGIEAISHLLAPPKGAYEYVKSILESKGENPTQAAKKLDVSASTVKRLLDGGSLTTNMAAKLHNTYKMDIDTLFNIEAQAHAYEARHIAKTA